MKNGFSIIERIKSNTFLHLPGSMVHPGSMAHIIMEIIRQKISTGIHTQSSSWMNTTPTNTISTGMGKVEAIFT